MKKFNKGMMITGTIAAVIAAATLAGCGNSPAESAKGEPAKAVQAVKGAEAEAPKVEEPAKAAEPAALTKSDEPETEKAEDTKPAEKTEEKKTEKKKSEPATETKPAAPTTVVIVVNNDTKKPETKTEAKKTETKKADEKKTADNVQKTASNTQKTANTTKPAAKKPAKKAEKQQAPTVVIPKEVYPVWVEGDMYAGTYYEQNAGRGRMDITRNSDGTYSVEVNWASSAFETSSWNFSGEFDGRAAMNYNNCRKTTRAFDENGNYTYDSYGYMTPYTTYTRGSGSIKFLDEGVLVWNDDMGDIFPGATFIACDRYNTKAYETGTAGSNYYNKETAKVNEKGTEGSNYCETETTKADEIGTAGSNYRENENTNTKAKESAASGSAFIVSAGTKADETGTAGSSFAAKWDATGTFVDTEGGRVTLEIVKAKKRGTFDCTVRMSGSAFDSTVYHFRAHFVDGSLVYEDGYVTYEEYDENGELVICDVLSEDSFGSIFCTGAAGLRWTDSDGSSYVFVSDIECA